MTQNPQQPEEYPDSESIVVFKPRTESEIRYQKEPIYSEFDMKAKLASVLKEIEEASDYTWRTICEIRNREGIE